jgi:hypothetical protein
MFPVPNLFLVIGQLPFHFIHARIQPGIRIVIRAVGDKAIVVFRMNDHFDFHLAGFVVDDHLDFVNPVEIFG